MSATGGDHAYDVCLSYASEQRSYARRLAEVLRSSGVTLFFDEYERAALWGEDLFIRLDHIYRRASRFCVIFVSAEYARKMWTGHELRSVLARSLEESGSYLLPLRFDDTELAGLRPTVSYVDAQTVEPEEVARMLLARLHIDPPPVEVAPADPPRPSVFFARLRTILAANRRLTMVTDHNRERYRRIASEHHLVPGERLIAFVRWRGFLNFSRGVAFTDWGIRFRRGTRGLAFPYARIDEYEIAMKEKLLQSEESGERLVEWLEISGNGDKIELHPTRSPRAIRSVSDTLDAVRELKKNDTAIFPRPD